MRLCQFQSEADEIFYAQALRTELEYRISSEFCKLFLIPALAVGLGTDERLERVAQSLAALIESCLYDCLEQSLVAS